MKCRLLLSLCFAIVAGCASSDRLERPGENLENGSQQWVCLADNGQWDCSDNQPRPIPPLKQVAPVPAPEEAPNPEVATAIDAPINAELPGNDPLSAPVETVTTEVAALPEIAATEQRAERVLEEVSEQVSEQERSEPVARSESADAMAAESTGAELSSPSIAPASTQAESALTEPTELEITAEPPTADLDTDAFLALPGDYYAVQVMAVKNRRDLEDALVSVSGFKPSVLQISSQGQAWFALFAGVYANRAEAEMAMTELRAAGHNPWLRKASGVQRAVRHHQQYFQN